MASPDPETRLLPLEGIPNFRDAGGYPTAAGGRIRRGRLWRSAHLAGATPADLATLAGLGLTAVVDLRGAAERALLPSPLPPGRPRRVEAPAETASLAPHGEAARAPAPDAAAVEQLMVETYRQLPFRPALVAAMREGMQALAEAEGAVVVHCHAGKDRTGLAVALVHATLGVHRDDILADYLLTNAAVPAETRLVDGLALLSARHGKAADPAAALALMSVAPSWLEAAFAAIAGAHGGIEAYAEAVLGVDRATRSALEARLLA